MAWLDGLGSGLGDEGPWRAVKALTVDKKACQAAGRRQWDEKATLFLPLPPSLFS